jgi:RNA polymerase sigma factor (TIGR02999 family)
MTAPRNVTALLASWSRDDPGALDRLMPLIYAELRRAAVRELRKERAGHTLQPTALVHELYLRLVDQRRVEWRDRAHFLGVASRIMRRILVDHARRHGADKRGGGVACVSIDDEATQFVASNEIPILAFDRALGRFRALNAACSRASASASSHGPR